MTNADSSKADGLKHYVDWAVKQGFAVIDANVPKHLSDVDVRLIPLMKAAITD